MSNTPTEVNHNPITMEIYSFLDNILSRIPGSTLDFPLSLRLAAMHARNAIIEEALERETVNLQTETHNIEDPIDPPPTHEVEAGGYPESMFLYLSDKEKESYTCSICYMILKNAYQCKNKHRFCHGCIYTWSCGNGDVNDKCPMCREDGLYAPFDKTNDKILKKCVTCEVSGCNWLGCLRDYEKHEHRYYNPSEFHVLSNLRQPNLFPQKQQQSTNQTSTSTPPTLPPVTERISELRDRTRQMITNIQQQQQHPTVPQMEAPNPLLVRTSTLTQTSSNLVPPGSRLLRSRMQMEQPRLPGSTTSEETQIQSPSLERQLGALRGANSALNVSTSCSLPSIDSMSNRVVNNPPAPVQAAQMPAPPVSLHPTMSTDSIADEEDLVYRRLIPVNRIQTLEQMRENREQLATMLTLMTLELEERRSSLLLAAAHARRNLPSMMTRNQRLLTGDLPSSTTTPFTRNPFTQSVDETVPPPMPMQRQELFGHMLRARQQRVLLPTLDRHVPDFNIGDSVIDTTLTPLNQSHTTNTQASNYDPSSTVPLTPNLWFNCHEAVSAAVASDDDLNACDGLSETISSQGGDDDLDGLGVSHEPEDDEDMSDTNDDEDNVSLLNFTHLYFQR